MDVEALKKATNRLQSRLDEPHEDNSDWCSATYQEAKQVAQLAGVHLYEEGQDMDARVKRMEEQLREKDGIIARLETQAGNAKQSHPAPAKPEPPKAESKKHDSKR